MKSFEDAQTFARIAQYCNSPIGITGLPGSSGFDVSLPSFPTIKVSIVGDGCKIEKDSDIYFKIIDSLSWFLINAIEKNHGSVYRGGPSLDNFSFDKGDVLCIGSFLEKTLLTAVKVNYVESQRWQDILTCENQILIRFQSSHRSKLH